MPQKGGYLNANKNTVGDVNQLLSMLSDTSYDNYTTNSTDTEQLKNKLFNILQDGGSPTDSKQYAGEFLKWFNFLKTKPTTYSLIKDDTTLYKYTDKKSQKTYLKKIVGSFDTLNFSLIDFENIKFLLNINEIIDILESQLEFGKSMKKINLSHNFLFDDHQNKIIRWFTFTKLISLNLDSTHLNVKVIKSIADALKTNTTLTELNISNNEISLDNAKEISDALKINTTLTKLGLSRTLFVSIGINEIVEFLGTNKTLTSLNLSLNNIEDFNGIRDALKTNTTLTELNLKHNLFTEIAKQEIEQIKKLKPKLKIII